MNMEDVTRAVSDALKDHDRKRDALALRIDRAASEALRATRLNTLFLLTASDEPAGAHWGRLAWVHPKAHCAQWAPGCKLPEPNRTGGPVLALWTAGESPRSILTVDLGYFDGQNMRHQYGPTYVHGKVLKQAQLTTLCDVARDLPRAIARAVAFALANVKTETAKLDEAIRALASE